MREYVAPGGVVAGGTRGTVEHVDEREGTVWVLMNDAQEALKYWDNRVVLSPFETEDLIECLAFTGPCYITWRRMAIAASVAAAFVLGSILNDSAASALSAIADLVVEVF